MRADPTKPIGGRRRIGLLLSCLALLLLMVAGVRWWLPQPANLAALEAPPPPESPFHLENPTDPPPGGLRLRSEPLFAPLQFTADPWRRKIRAFELVVRPRSTGAISGTLYFDTRDISFNEFGDELIPTNQTAEAHRVRKGVSSHY